MIRSRRTSGNQRRYPRATLRQVAFIRASQSVGISLSTIGAVLEFLPEGTEPTHEFWVRASSWQEMVNARIKQLERMRDLFTDCIGCGCLEASGLDKFQV